MSIFFSVIGTYYSGYYATVLPRKSSNRAKASLFLYRWEAFLSGEILSSTITCVLCRGMTRSNVMTKAQTAEELQDLFIDKQMSLLTSSRRGFPISISWTYKLPLPAMKSVQ